MMIVGVSVSLMGGLIQTDSGDLGRSRSETLEAFWVRCKCSHQRGAALLSQLLVMSIVDGGRRHHGDAAVTMGCVVPAEERLTVSSSMLDRGEARREVGRYLSVLVRRAKARFLSGGQTHPATVVPAGSNRSGRGGNETAEAFDVNGSL